MEPSSKVFSPSSKESKKASFKSRPAGSSPKANMPSVKNFLNSTLECEPFSTTNKETLDFDKANNSQFNISIGQIRDGFAKLYTENLESFELPLSLLPSDIHTGNILKISITRDKPAEISRRSFIKGLQDTILLKGDNF
jgi:hypothetical protein